MGFFVKLVISSSSASSSSPTKLSNLTFLKELLMRLSRISIRENTLFSPLSALLLFSFSLSLLFCTLLGAFLSCCDARYYIVEWIVDYPD